MEIPFHRPYITDEEISEVVDSIKSGWWTMGPKTVRFEKEFAGYLGAKHAVALNSCTAALHLALKAIDLKPADEVIVPTMTFTATGEVVCYFGAKPVIVDIEKVTHNMDLSALEKAITPRTKAVIPVHFAGQPCDMDEILQIAERHNLYVIEDAAHSVPAWYKGKMIGTIGDLTCFSFYATKTLATGEGGMVTTERDEWAERIKMLRLHGISRDAWNRYTREGSWYYEVLEAGFKYNMTDIQASLGVVQLKRLEWMWEKRRAIAEKYSAALKDSGVVIPPFVKPDRVSAWHLYVILLDLERLSIDRNRFIDELKNRGIGTSVHFIPLHIHPFYRKTYGYLPEEFPVATDTFNRTISLPIFPGMTDKETDFVIETVLQVAHKFRR